MRTAGVVIGAIVAGFVGFYLGLWALLAIYGLYGSGDVAFSAATTGTSGLLAGATAALVSRWPFRSAALLAIGCAVVAMPLGIVVSALGGDVVWVGAVSLLIAVTAALFALGRQR